MRMNKEEIRKRLNKIYDLFPEENMCEMADKLFAVIMEAFGYNKYNEEGIKDFILATV
ncbi:hypothetical protein LCGC14_0755540 [marine sediment metagenome]|uniref:Uncharacterized protein n=1 Tax=marine sediment metagenome TaxID=412755 RepID=A0A0F9SMZ2_9ZZZZ